MKLFIFLILVSFKIMASNWMPLSVIQNNGVEGYSLEADCLKSGEQCFDVGANPEIVQLGFYSIADAMGDDYEKPIWGTRSMVQSCADEADCLTIHETNECVDGRQSYYSIEDLEVWCNKIVGYEQKVVGKSFVKNQAAYDSYLANESSKKATQNALAIVKKRRECAGGVIDLFVLRNAQKGLTKQQVKDLTSTFAPIQDLLLNGSLETSKEEILAAPVDGVLITEGDKTALVGAVDKCLGL